MRKQIDFPRKLNFISNVQIENLVKSALYEDLGEIGDITTSSLLRREERAGRAYVIAKENGIVCGVEFFKKAFELVDIETEVEIIKKDGDFVRKSDLIAKVEGYSYSLLISERVALNFLGFLSGISTKVNSYVQSISFSQTKLIDTRKTLPGLRLPEKYAVATGGGYNHRLGLFDMILIKENHIKAIGNITEAVKRAKFFRPEMLVEVEIESLDQVEEVLKTEAEIVMLDNMSDEDVMRAFDRIKPYKYVEVSGNVDSERLIKLARIGVDFVSMGELTHTVKPLDVSMLIEG